MREDREKKKIQSKNAHVIIGAMIASVSIKEKQMMEIATTTKWLQHINKIRVCTLSFKVHMNESMPIFSLKREKAI